MVASSVTRPHSFHTNPQPRNLQVSGLLTFEESRWRECVLYFLFGIWSGQSNVTYRPKIDLGGDVTLRLDSDAKVYYAYGRSVELEYPTFDATGTLVVGYTQMEVEQGLVRFVKNNRIKMLVIRLCQGEVRLWKMPQRSRFGIASKDIPTLGDIMKTMYQG